MDIDQHLMWYISALKASVGKGYDFFLLMMLEGVYCLKVRGRVAASPQGTPAPAAAAAIQNNNWQRKHV